MNAIYCHAYNAGGNCLFTGGGPLQVGLFGCYAALWSADWAGTEQGGSARR